MAVVCWLQLKTINSTRTRPAGSARRIISWRATRTPARHVTTAPACARAAASSSGASCAASTCRAAAVYSAAWRVTTLSIHCTYFFMYIRGVAHDIIARISCTARPTLPRVELNLMYSLAFLGTLFSLFTQRHTLWTLSTRAQHCELDPSTL